MTAQHNRPVDHWPAAIIGAGDVGTDLRLKITRRAGTLTLAAMVDDADDVPALPDIKLVFDTRDAGHHDDWAALAGNGLRVLHFNPSGVGACCIPAVNLNEHLDAPAVGLGAGAAQAAVPIVAAVGQSGIVSYAEVVTSISARSVGAGARANIDEVNQATAAALETVGGARRGKAVLLLNPAEPPMPMRNTVFCLVDGPADEQRVETDVRAMLDKVGIYVPGYRLKHRLQFDTFGGDNWLYIPETGKFTGTKVTVLLEVVATGDQLPAHAGAVDMMTSAAITTAERIAAHAGETIGART
jgi:acetaldehyde dehydrogenase